MHSFLWFLSVERTPTWQCQHIWPGVMYLSAPTMIKIHLKKSKCDQFGVGSDKVLGATGADVCPVKAIISCIEHRGSRTGAFFIDSSHKPLSKSWFIAHIREYLDAPTTPVCRAKLPDRRCDYCYISGHWSLRWWDDGTVLCFYCTSSHPMWRLQPCLLGWARKDHVSDHHLLFITLITVPSCSSSFIIS